MLTGSCDPWPTLRATLCVRVCVCVTVVVRGSAELRLQLGFGGRKKKCILLIQDRSMCQILREIGEELWCDGIAVFECP